MFATVLTVFLYSSNANAQTFNNPGIIPTVTITNATQRPCSGLITSGCWKTNETASPGDVIAVQVYYKNTSSTPVSNVSLYISPKNTGAAISVNYFGGVGNTVSNKATGNAMLSLPIANTVTYIPGSARFFSGSNSMSVDETNLFGSYGFNIGTVYPGEQGAVVANFQVGQTQIVNPPVPVPPTYYYQCNDGIDNDGDGYRDYPADQGCVSSTDNDESNIVYNTNLPKAVTTVATILSTSQANLNGVAVPNTTYGYGTATAWFEWGTTGYLGNRTVAQNINGTSNANNYFTDTLNNLVPGTWYYYRAVVQNQYGIAYGDIVRFNTQPGANTPTTPVVVGSKNSLAVALKVENTFENACPSSFVDYSISYKNQSSQTMKDSVLRFTLPKEVTYVSSARGDYDVTDRTVTIDLGDVKAGAEGTFIVHAKINGSANEDDLTVATGTIVYTNTVTKSQEIATAYSLITIEKDCPQTLGLGGDASGFWSFLPNTLTEWLLLVLAILGLVVLGRNLYAKKA